MKQRRRWFRTLVGAVSPAALLVACSSRPVKTNAAPTTASSATALTSSRPTPGSGAAPATSGVGGQVTTGPGVTPETVSLRLTDLPKGWRDAGPQDASVKGAGPGGCPGVITGATTGYGY